MCLRRVELCGCTEDVVAGGKDVGTVFRLKGEERAMAPASRAAGFEAGTCYALWAISDGKWADPVLNYVLTQSDQYPFGEERRLFYVSITSAKVKTVVLYGNRFPSVFVNEFLHPEKIVENSYAQHPNANKRWTKDADQFLLQLHSEGKDIKYIANKMGRSQTSIAIRLNKLLA